MTDGKVTKQWLNGTTFDISTTSTLTSSLQEQTPSSGGNPNTCGVISYNKMDRIYHVKYENCNERRQYLCQSTCVRQCVEFNLTSGTMIEADRTQHVAGSKLK